MGVDTMLLVQASDKPQGRKPRIQLWGFRCCWVVAEGVIQRCCGSSQVEEREGTLISMAKRGSHVPFSKIKPYRSTTAIALDEPKPAESSTIMMAVLCFWG
jgi:hypothetical protein